MKLSIVTTLYHSEPYLAQFLERLGEIGKRITQDIQFVFVNDGSPDNSVKALRDLMKTSSHNIKVVDLARNYGHHKAMMAGLEHADGDEVFLIDADLEEDPELLETFYRMKQDDPTLDVVYGVVKARPGSLFKKISGSLFYKVFNHFSEIKVPENLSVIRLMSKDYIQCLLKHRESEVMIGGLWAMTGFNQKAYEFTRSYKGKTTYNIKRQLELAMNSLIIFSTKPLYYLFIAGALVSMISFGFVVFYLFLWLVNGVAVPGYTSLIISTWLIGGLVIFSIGLLGIYLSIIFKEVKLRPRYIAREIFTNYEDNNA